MKDYRSYIKLGEQGGNVVLLFKIRDEKQFFASFKDFSMLPFVLTDEEQALVQHMAIEAVKAKHQADVFIDGEKCELTSVLNN